MGDKIRLTEEAQPWTRGRVFRVDEVRLWGVICRTIVKRDEPCYRAAWRLIAEVVQ